MREIWLRTNRHVLFAILVCVLLTLAVGAGLAVAYLPSGGWLGWLGLGVGLLSLLLIAALVPMMRAPRLAYENGSLLVYLQWLQPTRVPIDIVEVLFMGQGPAQPGSKSEEATETKNAVIRLAERAEEWHRQPVRRELGSWCDGYIVIRGTWCEPLSVELLNALNSRLVDIHRQRRQQKEASA